MFPDILQYVFITIRKFNKMTVDILLLTVLIISGLITVTGARLLRVVIGLAVTSVILSVIMFRMMSPYAAVFELSVCAGLIPVFFITAISFAKRVPLQDRRRQVLSKYGLLPIILVIILLILVKVKTHPGFKLDATNYAQDVRFLMWNVRHMDLLGQIIILLTGAFGVIVLFKEKKK